MPNPKVVILCLENRSFDEYFGTFPGAIGFYDPDAGDVFSQPGLTSDGSDLQPFRMSSFSTSSQWSPPMNHSWWPFVQEWNYGAMNGFSTQAPAADSAVTLPDGTGYASGACVMGYYAANDIAYRWSLAQSFLLCDTYFTSQMGATAPNRMMLMSGTVIDPSLFAQQPPPWLISDTGPGNDPMLGNPDTGSPVTPVSYPWQSYFGMIGSGYPDGWAIFDDQDWQPPWLAWTPGLNDPDQPVPYYQGWPAPYFVKGLNMLAYLTDAAQQPAAPGLQGGPAGFYYSAQGSQPQSSFEAQAAAGLPGISFILPPSFLTEHPSFPPSDGESYLARIVNAVVSGPDWADPGVVLIITYDEHDGHFDHVNPPTSMSGQPLQGPAAALPVTPSTPMTRQPAGPPATGSWEPWVSVQQAQGPPWTGPLGAAMRVPTIIVSPWTYRAGLSSQVAPNAQFDHSSVIRYLEELTNVKCLPNLPEAPPLNWRRETFTSLSALIPAGNTPVSKAEVLAQLPSVPQVDAWRTDLLTRLFGPSPAYPPSFSNPSEPWKGPSVIVPNPGPDPLQAWPALQQTCYVVADKTTFGLDEVQATATAAGDPGGSATFAGAFWVMLDGFDAAELNTGSLPPPGYAPLTPAITLSGAPEGISLTIGPAQAIASMPEGIPQRFRFEVDVTFTTDGPGSYPAFAGVTLESPVYITVQVSFTSHLTWTAPAFELELVVAPDPYIQNGPISYLSTDLRAYMVATDGSGDLFGVPCPPSGTPAGFIADVIAALNSSPAQQAAFAATQPANDQAASSTVTALPDYDGKPVANFAIVRVTLQGLSQSAYNVRVFFRLCPALSTGTAFDPATLYRSTPLDTPNAPNPAGSQPDTVTGPNFNAPTSASQPGYPWLTKVPLLGLNGANAPGTGIVTFPFFAVDRVTPAQAMYQQPPDWPNTQTISPAPGGTGEPVFAFFGCWLDINQAGVPQFPGSVPLNGQADGPFTSSSPAPASIASLITSQHQCLVAEIAYDEITIPPGASPGTTDKLAQRNLSVIGGQS
jgi:phospholipase C